MFSRASVVVAVLFASGCASMSRNECLTVDWRTVGYEDGVAGYSGDRIAQHRKACAKHEVSPDLDLYRSGREAGLREYCEPANGFRVGAGGHGYTGQCPADLDQEFVTAYESGRQLHRLQTQVEGATRQLESKRRELNRAEDDIVDKSALAISSDATHEQRAQAVVDVKQLAERVGRLKSEIRRLEKDRVLYEQDLESYQAGLEYVR
jgi:uncharacterized small protein (DUF1192 family)